MPADADDPAEPHAIPDDPGPDVPAQEEPPAPDLAVAPANGAVWAEVAAVLAVGVIPHIAATVVSLIAGTAPPLPYWLDALELTVLSGCTILVTLYLIGRSGEPWGKFGLARLRIWDFPLGLGLFIAADSLWLFCCGPYLWDNWSPKASSLFPRPRLAVDYALMVLKYGVAAFSEELVTRAYLITRFEQLLRSRPTAVLLAAALFASYHAYQGPGGLLFAMALGIMNGVAYLLIRRVWPLAIGHAVYNIHLDLIMQ